MRAVEGRLFAIGAIAAATAAFCLAVTGCGDSDAGDSGAAAATAGSPEQYTRNVANLLATTADKKGCKQLDAVNRAASVRFDCPYPKDGRRSLAKFKVVDSAVYGTGAVVDYTSGQAPQGGSVALVESPKGTWAISRFGILGGPTVGTKDAPSKAGFDRALAGYLDTVRKGDCKAYDSYTANGIEDEGFVCAVEFLKTKALAKALKADPGLRPRYVGGNKQFGFYSLSTKKPAPLSLTIVAVKSGPDATRPYQILDAAPAALSSS